MSAERLRKAWRVRVADYDDSDLVYAPCAGRARMDLWRNTDGNVRIVDITVRREPEKDVRLPPRDPIADELTEESRHCLLHAFGGNQGDPVKAGYRNHFYTHSEDPRLTSLRDKGLMTMKPVESETFGEGMAYFILTERGRHVALSLVPEYRP